MSETETVGESIVRQEAEEPKATGVQMLVHWNGLPRVLMMEVELDAGVKEEEFAAAMEKIKTLLDKEDLALRCDEQSIAGMCRWFCRRFYKLLNGRVGQVNVGWKPEAVTLDAKQVVSP